MRGMTDVLGQNGQPGLTLPDRARGWLSGGAGLLALSPVAAVGLSACSTDVAKADTFV